MFEIFAKIAATFLNFNAGCLHEALIDNEFYPYVLILCFPDGLQFLNPPCIPVFSCCLMNNASIFKIENTKCIKDLFGIGFASYSSTEKKKYAIFNPQAVDRVVFVRPSLHIQRFKIHGIRVLKKPLRIEGQIFIFLLSISLNRSSSKIHCVFGVASSSTDSSTQKYSKVPTFVNV